MIESADALVARLSITVTDMKLPPTPRTAEETSQQGFASADGAAAHEPLAVGVVGDQVLIPLKLDPGNVTLMMILDQNTPATPIPLHASDDTLTPVLNNDAHGPAAEGVSAGVDWVGQDVMDRWIYRGSPDNPIRRVADGQDW
jgi:hypothetical protein